MAMFPLGSVLFPHMPLPLRVFEPRYLAMLGAILQDEPAEFGVVLIERGQEVGGGDARVDIGTVAQVSDLDTADETVLVLAQGVRRIEVVSWGDDDPYPRAEVRDLPDPPWSAELTPLLETTERLVRRVLKRVGEFAELRWPADVGLDDDPAAACWQLAAIAPLGELDQLDLLRSTDLRRLLERTAELVTEIDEVYGGSRPEEG
jgi:Lon protease-like protein